MKKLAVLLCIIFIFSMQNVNVYAQSKSNCSLLRDVWRTDDAGIEKFTVKDMRTGKFYVLYDEFKVSSLEYMLNSMLVKRSVRMQSGAYDYQICGGKKNSHWSTCYINITIGKSIEIGNMVYDTVSTHFNEKVFKMLLKPKLTSITQPSNEAVINGKNYKLLAGAYGWSSLTEGASDTKVVECDIIQLIESQKEIPTVDSFTPIYLKFQYLPCEYSVEVFSYPDQSKCHSDLQSDNNRYYMPNFNGTLVLHLWICYEQGGGHYYLKLNGKNN